MNRFFINSIFIAMCFFSTLLCLSNNNTVDSLKLILNNKKQKDSSDVYYYNLIFIEFFNKSFYDSALIYSDSAYALSQLLNYTKGKATSSLNIGAANMRKGNYDVAIESFHASLKLYELLNDTVKLSGCYNNLGYAYYQLKKFEKSLEYHQAALKIREDKLDTFQIISSLVNIGNIYNDQAKFDLAMENYQKALNYTHSIQNYKAPNNAGNIKVQIANIYNNIGNVYLQKKEYDKALQSHKQALKIREELSDKSGLVGSYMNIGEIFNKKQDYSNAVNWYIKGVNLAGQIGENQRLVSLYQSLAIVLEKKEDYKNAYFFYTNYTALKDSIFSKESTEKILEVETKYQTQKKENEIVKLKQEKQLQYIELESRKIQRNFLIAVLILVFFILLLLFKLYYSKLNTNKILERKNKQIEKQTELLEKSNILLEKLNATKDKFFSIIAHDVKNPLMAIKSASMAMQSGNIDYTKNMVLINGIARSAETLSEYLDNLLKWALCQTEKIDVNITDVNIFKVVNEIVQIYSASIDNKKLNINISIPINFCVKSDENLLSFIFRNVINNAIKFTQENGSINISTSIQNNQYCFSVSDTGIGIKRKDLENLFSIEQNKHTINNGSSGEKGTGLGLILCKEFVDLLGGKIEVKSVQGVGSTFSFSFPFIKQDDEK